MIHDTGCCLFRHEQVTDKGGEGTLIRVPTTELRADPTDWTWGRKRDMGCLENMEEEITKKRRVSQGGE